MVNTKTTVSKKVLAIVLAVACMVAFTPAMAFTSSAHAAAFKVSPTKATVYVGKYKTLKSTKTAKWTSSKKSVAKLTKSKGKTVKVKGVKAGTATISVKYKTTTKKIKITVKKAPTALTSVTVENLTDTTNALTTKVTTGDRLDASVDPAGATVSYQWYADDVAIAGATSHSYTVEAAYVGKAITVKATGVSAYGGTVTSTATAKVSAITLASAKVQAYNATTKAYADVNVATDTVGVGDQLKAVGQTAAPAAVNDVTYQWYQDAATAGHEISGATAQTYTVTKANIGHAIVVVVTPKTGVLGTAQTVAFTNPVASAVNVAISNGTAGATTGKVGDTLTAVTSPAAAADAVTYQWNKGGVAISGATSATYTPTEAGTYGVTIAIKTGEITYTLGATPTATFTLAKSALGTATAKNITAYGAGRTTNVVGDKLAASCSTGTATANAYDVAWMKYNPKTQTAKDAIACTGTGAATSEYTLDTSDLGMTVFAVLTGTGTDVAGQKSTSNEITGITKSVTTATVALNSASTAIEATPGTGETVTYQWYRVETSKATTATPTAIAGATSATYTPTSADHGYTISLVVTGTDNYTGTAAGSKTVNVAINGALTLN
jgi:hypothetical protein